MKLTPQAEEVAKARYFAPDEDWEAMCRRVSHAVSQAEKLEDREKYEELFFNMIYNQLAIPAGRILRNAGFDRALLNCYSLGVDDNIESIGELIKNSLIVASHGGGVGLNISPLRPKDMPLSKKGGVSSGTISFLKIIDTSNSIIKTGGQRRAALLSLMNVSHPEIFDFIEAKLDHGELTNFNISVAINNRFIEAVKNNEDWNLEFRGQIFETVKAKEIWNRLIECMLKSADPGILNEDLIRYYNNAEYFAPFNAPNPCGEIPLERNSSCCLGNLVLPNFATEKRMKWKELERTIHLMVRFLDNILTINKYPFREIEETSLKSRRIGMGVTGLADLLLHFNLRYGHQDSLFFIEKLFKFIRDIAYCSSIELAKEKGTFPAYSTDRFLQNNFIRTLPIRLKKLIEKYGIRNVSIMTCPPVGSTSQLTSYSSGIEPILSKAYWRNDALGMRPVIHQVIKDNNGEIPNYFIEAHNLTAEDHLLVQATIQQYVDNSISKTINFSKNTTKEELSNILLNYISDLKGVTIYVDGTRKNQVLTPMTDEEIKKYLNESETGTINQDCPTGKCDL